MSLAKRFNLATALEAIETEEMVAAAARANETDIEDVSESIDYSVDEMGKGLEAISDLVLLSNKIDAQASKGIAVENYSDIAQIAFEQIKKNIGLEDSSLSIYSDVNIPKQSNETKDPSALKKFIIGLIEAIKKIWKNIKEFFKKIMDGIKLWSVNKKMKIQLLIKQLKETKNIARQSATIEIEHGVYYRDKQKVDSSEVFGGMFTPIDFNRIMSVFKTYPINVSGIIDNNASGKEIKDKLKKVNESFIGEFGKMKSLLGFSFSKKKDVISPNGVLFNNDDTGIGYSNDLEEHGIETFDKQIVETIPGVVAVDVAEKILTIIEAFDKFAFDSKKTATDVLEVVIDKRIEELESTQREMLKSGNMAKADETKDKLDIIKVISKSVIGLSVSSVKFSKDYINGLMWYLDLSYHHKTTVNPLE